MKSKTHLLAEFEAWIPFVISLKDLDSDRWIAPLQAEKWSTGEVISHIMLWDKYFLQSAIEKISSGQPLTLINLPFNDFNENAAAYAQTVTKDQLLDETLNVRKALIELLQLIPEENYKKAYIDADGRPFEIYEYLVDFIGHDKHHGDQIRNFLAAAL